MSYQNASAKPRNTGVLCPVIRDLFDDTVIEILPRFENVFVPNRPNGRQ
jgi:hypothetical protein